jgi:trehalose utilization protein
MIRVTIYNEFIHEKQDENVKKIYPNGIHQAIADFLQSEEITVRTATLEDPECGLTQEVLDNTDVLLWWGHVAHHLVPDEVARRVQESVLKGMGFIALHSGHHSKPFRYLMGTTCNVNWREDGDFCRLWICDPSHPICKGLDRYLEVPHEEMYTEPFGIPEPDQLVFIGWYDSGEVFRSGCCYKRGNGKIFYFQPGHETYPTYYLPDVQKVIRNAVYWAAPDLRVPELICPWVPRIERKDETKA